MRNITNDDHLDLKDKRKLLGKTMAYLSRNANTSGLISLQVRSEFFALYLNDNHLDLRKYSLQEIWSSL